MKDLKREEMWFMQVVSATMTASLVSLAISVEQAFVYLFLTVMLLVIGNWVGIIEKVDKR